MIRKSEMWGTTFFWDIHNMDASSCMVAHARWSFSDLPEISNSYHRDKPWQAIAYVICLTEAWSTTSALETQWRSKLRRCPTGTILAILATPRIATVPWHLRCSETVHDSEGRCFMVFQMWSIPQKLSCHIHFDPKVSHMCQSISTTWCWSFWRIVREQRLKLPQVRKRSKLVRSCGCTRGSVLFPSLSLVFVPRSSLWFLQSSDLPPSVCSGLLKAVF